MSHFNVSFIVWAKSQDSVHKPPFLKRKESRSGSNRGPSAYQPSALPLGHTGSRVYWSVPVDFILNLEEEKELGRGWGFVSGYWRDGLTRGTLSGVAAGLTPTAASLEFYLGQLWFIRDGEERLSIALLLYYIVNEQHAGLWSSPCATCPIAYATGFDMSQARHALCPLCRKSDMSQFPELSLSLSSSLSLSLSFSLSSIP